MGGGMTQHLIGIYPVASALFSLVSGLRPLGTKLPLKLSGVHRLRLVRACVASGLAVLAEIQIVHVTVLVFAASVC